MFRLSAKIVGDDIRHYETHGHIKAATYRNLRIQKTPQGYEVCVTLDV